MCAVASARKVVPAGLRSAYELVGGAPSEGAVELDVHTLKQLYRQRALSAHPDRARAIGQDPGLLTQSFQEVTAAYRRLYQFLLSATGAASMAHPRSPCVRRAKFRSASATAARRESQPAAPTSQPAEPWLTKDHWTHALPDQPLLFGHYLYYSGRIPMSALVEAVAWQRQQKPYFGQLAVAAGYVDAERVRWILDNQRSYERIGEAAVRLRYLPCAARNLLVIRQRSAYKLIGQFFVERGYLTPAELLEAAASQSRHNSACARRHY